MSRALKKSPRGKATRKVVDLDEMDESMQRLQMAKRRRRFQNLFTQTPSSARVQQGEAGPSGGKPSVVKDGKFYAPPTMSWRSRYPMPLTKAPTPAKERPERPGLLGLELYSKGTQVSEPAKKTRDVKVGVKPSTATRGNQAAFEPPIEVENLDEEKDGIVEETIENLPSTSQGLVAFPATTQRQIKKIVRSIAPIAAFVKNQTREEEEKKGILENIKESQNELQGKLDSVIGISGENTMREDQILSAIQECTERVEPCRGPHINQDMVLDIPDQIDDVRDLVEEYMGNFHSFTTNIEIQITTLMRGLKDLKQEQKGLFTVIEQEREKREEASKNTDKDDIDSGFKEASSCTCAQQKAKSKTGSFIRCQNCMNTFNGEQFLKSNGLYSGVPEDDEIANRMGKIIQCVDVDAPGRLSHHIIELKNSMKDWDIDKQAEAMSALFSLSMQRKSPKSCKVIMSHVKQYGDMHDRNDVLAKCLNGAVLSGETNKLEDLFQNIDQADRKELINAPIMQEDGTGKRYNIFEAVRNVDVETLEYLISQGACLEMVETDRSIMHEIILMSSKRSALTHDLEHNMQEIIELIYNKAGQWWNHREEDLTGGMEEIKCKETALSFLMSMKNGNNQNALQFAVKIAPPYVVQHIVNNYPYKFITDPVSFGKFCGRTAYVVDEIEPVRVRGRRDHSSILDTVANRVDTGNEMVQIEPFRTMLQDKWYRYRVFYWLWFLSYILYVCVFSACAVGRQTGGSTLAELYSKPGAYFRLAAEIMCLLFLPLFFYGEYCDFVRYGWLWNWDIDREKSFRIANVFLVTCMIMIVILRLSLSPYEDIFLCIALITAWMMATQFLIPLSKNIGMFPLVYFKVFKDDFLKCYSWIFLLILLGSSISTYCAYQGSTIVVQEIPKDGFWEATFSMVQLTFGFLDTDYVSQARLPGLGILLFLIYVWMGHILLLNLFIAMVNDTYTACRQEQKETWIRIKAWFAMLMDRRLPSATRIQFNGLSHLKQDNFTFQMIIKMKMFTTTDLIYTKRSVLSVTNEEEKQLIVIVP